jgi:hypothetical protein
LLLVVAATGSSPLRLLSAPLYYRPLLAGLTLNMLQQVGVCGIALSGCDTWMPYSAQVGCTTDGHLTSIFVGLDVPPPHTQVTGQPAVMYYAAGILRDAGVLENQGKNGPCSSLTKVRNARMAVAHYVAQYLA